MTTLASRIFKPPEPIPEPPPWFTGSWPEYLVYQELGEQGYVADVDFSFQSGQLGGRMFLGGLVIDFVFRRPPGLAIEVNSRYFHYDRPAGRGPDQGATDIIKRQQMAGLGYTLIFCDDDAILQDVEWIVLEALSFRDHSELQL